jgi:hypothetical protein
MTLDDIVYPDIEQRGRVYYLRKRVPSRYAAIESRTEVNLSLKTRDPYHDVECRNAIWAKLLHEWEAALAGHDAPASRAAYDGALAVLGDLGLPWRPMQQIAAGPIDDLLLRVERIAKLPRDVGGGRVRPGWREPPRHPRLRHAGRVSAHPHALCRGQEPHPVPAVARQVPSRGEGIHCGRGRQARASHHRRRCRSLLAALGDPARRHPGHDGPCDQALHPHGQHVQGLPLRPRHPPQRLHEPVPRPHDGAHARRGMDPEGSQARPAGQVDHRCSTSRFKTDGLNEEAHGIAIICAEFGTRENEIYDLPPDAIVLDHPIPHLVLDVVLEGEFRREIKNIVSKRKVPLLGRGLAVMRRYPKGFSRYRDTANYSNTINSYFRERKLFPVCKEDPDHRYTIGGLRHTFENRMRHARIDNEERAFLMGHSIEAIRGRPIYGSDLELPIRALLLEKIAFPTDDWTPRSHEELDAAIDRLLKEEGYRRR